MGPQSHINHKDGPISSKSWKGNFQNESRSQSFLNIPMIISLCQATSTSHLTHGVQIFFTLHLSLTLYNLQWGYLLKIWVRTSFPSASIRPDDLATLYVWFDLFSTSLCTLNCPEGDRRGTAFAMAVLSACNVLAQILIWLTHNSNSSTQ